MRELLLASTMLGFVAVAAAQQTTITPGSGSLTDAIGGVWSISATGAIQDSGRWVAGGGGTAALTIINGVVYGLDAHGRGWFTLNAGGQYWSSSIAPPTTTTTVPPATAAAQTSTVAGQTTTTVPATAAPQTGCASGTATGGFHVANGQIIGPNGQPFIAKGVDLWVSDMGAVAATLISQFPGVNIVRVYDASYQSGAYTNPSAYASFIQAMTSQGIVVVIVDAYNGAGDGGGGQGVAFTGQVLFDQQAWYAAFAQTYANNPYVWFGPNNEPPGAGLTPWQQESYNTIRSAGNNSIIMLDLPGGGYPGTTIAAYGMDPSVYAQMTNVVLDPHYYGWVSGFSMDQGTVSSTLANELNAAQMQTASGTAPEIIGEYGNSTDGSSIDRNWQQVVNAVNTSGAGSTAWADPGGGGSGDILAQGGLTQYGQMVAGYVSQSGGAVAGGGLACPALASNALAQANSAAAVAAATGTPQAGANDVIPEVTTVQPTPSAGLQQADGDLTAAEAIGTQAQAQTLPAGGSATTAPAATQAQAPADSPAPTPGMQQAAGADLDQAETIDAQTVATIAAQQAQLQQLQAQATAALQAAQAAMGTPQ